MDLGQLYGLVFTSLSKTLHFRFALCIVYFGEGLSGHYNACQKLIIQMETNLECVHSNLCHDVAKIPILSLTLRPKLTQK